MKIVPSRHMFFAGILAVAVAAAGIWPASADDDAPLTVVELFTSQSCPHSPEGDNNLAILAERDDVLALTFPVTYWNYLGWKDTFAREAFTARQKGYIASMPDQWLYTPQLVVQGRVGVSGDDLNAVYDTIDGVTATLSQTASLVVRAAEGAQEVTVAAQHLKDTATLTFVAWEPGPLTVEVTSGKNAGKVLDYVNVVRSLIQIDELAPARAASLLVDIPEDAKGLPCAFLLQDKGTGSILSAALCK